MGGPAGSGARRGGAGAEAAAALPFLRPAPAPRAPRSPRRAPTRARRLRAESGAPGPRGPPRARRRPGRGDA